VGVDAGVGLGVAGAGEPVPGEPLGGAWFVAEAAGVALGPSAAPVGETAGLAAGDPSMPNAPKPTTNARDPPSTAGPMNRRRCFGRRGRYP
jgi:hypothetical protein